MRRGDGYEARDDEKQEKAPALICAGTSTSARSAGGSQVSYRRFSEKPNMRLTLFQFRRAKKAGICGFSLTLFQKMEDFQHDK